MIFSKPKPKKKNLDIIKGGLLGESERKNLSQIAEDTVDVSYHSLRHFLVRASRGEQDINDRRLKVMASCRQTKPSTGFSLIVDDSGHRKSGNFTDGVGRQYIGEIGKTDNGIVVVTTHLYDGTKSLPLDIELYQHANSLALGKKDPDFVKKPDIALNLPDTLSDKVEELESQIKQIQSTFVSDIQPDTVTDTNLDEKIHQAICTLKSDREFLRAIAREVKKISTVSTEEENNNTKKIPVENELEGGKNQSQDNPQVTAIEAANSANSEGFDSHQPKLLSKKEAYAIALQRGYKSSDTAFAQWFRDHRGGKLHGIKKHSDRGKYIDVGE